MKTSVCYLLHFSAPIGSDRKKAQHYLGWTPDLDARLESHRQGKGTSEGGARITQVFHERGISFECVRTWENGDRKLERRLKNRKRAADLCPVCRAARQDND